jgi:hypothetical protein
VRREDERRLLAGSHDTEMGALGIGSAPPAWVDLCEELQEEMERIAQKIQELQKVGGFVCMEAVLLGRCQCSKRKVRWRV